MLLALRRGKHSAAQLREQFSGNYMHGLTPLLKAGLAGKDSDGDGGVEYYITPAGRAACPFRNEKAATAAAPEIFTMPKGETHVTCQQVLAVILAGGVKGATRKQLIEKFASRASEQAIDMHITALNRQKPPVIFKPKPGVMVGIEFQQDTQFEAAPTAAETAPETASTATDDWTPEALATDPVTHDVHGVSLAVDHHDVGDLSAEHLDQQWAQIGNMLPHLNEFEVKMLPGGVTEHQEKYSDRLPSFVPTVVEDIRLSDPDSVEFCIYSSGGLDILSDDVPITLDAPVLAKLRRFLGLFQEAA